MRCYHSLKLSVIFVFLFVAFIFLISKAEEKTASPVDSLAKTEESVSSAPDTTDLLKKALGVYSTLRQSGSSTGKGRQGKEGSRHGRRALFQVVFRCVRRSTPDNDFKDYYLGQVARGKPRLKALLPTMGKLAEIIYHCLKTGEHYQYQGIYRHAQQDSLNLELL